VIKYVTIISFNITFANTIRAASAIHGFLLLLLGKAFCLKKPYQKYLMYAVYPVHMLLLYWFKVKTGVF